LEEELATLVSSGPTEDNGSDSPSYQETVSKDLEDRPFPQIGWSWLHHKPVPKVGMQHIPELHKWPFL
jgi:hypothetical protein